jgi:hypothetical protein
MNSPGGNWDFSGLTDEQNAELDRLVRKWLGEAGSHPDLGRLTEEERARWVEILRDAKAPSKEARAEMEEILTGAKPPTEEEQAEAEGILTEEVRAPKGFSRRPEDLSAEEELAMAEEVFESHRRKMDAPMEQQFHASLQICTPLEVLEHHGELFTGPPSATPRYGTEAGGIWLPTFPGMSWMEPRLEEQPEPTHDSDVGPVRASEYLPFLRDFRRIVEQEASVEQKLAALEGLPARSRSYARFWQALSEEYQGFPESFVEEREGKTEERLLQDTLPFEERLEGKGGLRVWVIQHKRETIVSALLSLAGSAAGYFVTGPLGLLLGLFVLPFSLHLTTRTREVRNERGR